MCKQNQTRPTRLFEWETLHYVLCPRALRGGVSDIGLPNKLSVKYAIDK